jgi:hypothetical protein
MEPHTLLVGMLLLSLWKAVYRFIKKLNTGPAIPLLVMHVKACESGYNKDLCTPMFIAAVFTIAKL